MSVICAYFTYAHKSLDLNTKDKTKHRNFAPRNRLHQRLGSTFFARQILTAVSMRISLLEY
jgi:hypothetical protein